LRNVYSKRNYVNTWTPDILTYFIVYYVEKIAKGKKLCAWLICDEFIYVLSYLDLEESVSKRKSFKRVWGAKTEVVLLLCLFLGIGYSE
jgi:hypothetical protein